MVLTRLNYFTKHLARLARVAKTPSKTAARWATNLAQSFCALPDPILARALSERRLHGTASCGSASCSGFAKVLPAWLLQRSDMKFSTALVRRQQRTYLSDLCRAVPTRKNYEKTTALIWVGMVRRGSYIFNRGRLLPICAILVDFLICLDDFHIFAQWFWHIFVVFFRIWFVLLVLHVPILSLQRQTIEFFLQGI